MSRYEDLIVRCIRENHAQFPHKIDPERVCRKILDRAEHGLQKYGVTVEREDLTYLQWLIHAQEEAMDLCVYLTRISSFNIGDINTLNTAMAQSMSVMMELQVRIETEEKKNEKS